MARDLLNRSNEFVGIDQRLWLVTETGGYGKDATGGLIPVATDGIEHVNAKIEFNIPREDAAHRSGRSRVVRLSGKKEAKFSYEGYIVPGDPDGSNHPTLSDAHPMLLSAFGSCDETDPTKKIYKLTRSTTSSFRMLEEGSHFSRLVVGCVADSLTFTLPGDGKAMMKVEGFASDVLSSGESLAASAVVASNNIPVTTGTGQRFQVGAYLDGIDKTDGNTRKFASRKITAIVGDTLTISGAAVTLAQDDIIIGAAPDFTATSSEKALLGLKGSFSTGSFGALDCDLLSAEITLKNNYTVKNFTYGRAESCGFIADKRRDVSLKLDILLTKANYDFYQRNQNFIADSVTITLAPQDIQGPILAALGRTYTFRFQRVEFNIPAIEQPSDGFVKLSLEGVALATDINTGNNEFELEIS
jgi:hypothetical protein